LKEKKPSPPDSPASQPDSPASPRKRPVKWFLGKPKDSTEESIREFAHKMFEQLKAHAKELEEEKAKENAEENAKKAAEENGEQG
jgi:hypothetical protein